MGPADVPADVNEAYALVKNLMFDQVHKFYRRYGGDREELIGQAGEAFARGHAEFVSGTTVGGHPIKDSYATSIRRWVWFVLFDKMRARIAKNDLTEAIGERDFEDPSASFDAVGWAEEISDDARAVVQLIVEPPRGLRLAAERRGGTARNYRSTVREWLADRGWPTARINAAFAQIKDALK